MNTRHTTADTTLGQVTIVAGDDAITGLYFQHHVRRPAQGALGSEIGTERDDLLWRDRGAPRRQVAFIPGRAGGGREPVVHLRTVPSSDRRERQAHRVCRRAEAEAGSAGVGGTHAGPRRTIVPADLTQGQHGVTVLRVCRALLAVHDADDAWSETPDTTNVEARLVTIARRKAIDVHRAAKRNPLPVESLPEAPTGPGIPGAREEPRPTASKVSERTIRA